MTEQEFDNILKVALRKYVEKEEKLMANASDHEFSDRFKRRMN